MDVYVVENNMQETYPIFIFSSKELAQKCKDELLLTEKYTWFVVRKYELDDYFNMG